MEQYELNNFYPDLRHALKHFKPIFLFVRPRGSLDEEVKQTLVRIGQKIAPQTLEVKKTVDEKSLSVRLDGKEVFVYELDEICGNRFSLAYERNRDASGVVPCLPTGIDTNDETLPSVHTSMFRSANYNYLIGISFEGKIPLRFAAWYNSRHDWKMWQVAKRKRRA